MTSPVTSAGRVGSDGVLLDGGAHRSGDPLDRAALVDALRAGRRARRRRYGVVCTVLLLVTALAFALSLGLGRYPVALLDVMPAALGLGDPAEVFIVQEVRLSRAVAAVLVGIAFGVSGRIVQAVAGNELASPDIIGITAGASAAAVLAIVGGASTAAAVSLAALAGGLGISAVLYALAWRDGLSGQRFVLIGIGLAALAFAVVQYAITRGDLREVQRAVVWLTGSLNGSTWEQVRALTVALAALLPLLVVATRGLSVLRLGDDLARGLGVGAERARLLALFTAVALASTATALAGPVAFVALLAGPIARRLVGGGGVQLVPAALVGATLLLVSDLIAREGIPSAELPAGVVTGLLGAPYLLWLLVTTNRAADA